MQKSCDLEHLFPVIIRLAEGLSEDAGTTAEDKGVKGQYLIR